MTPHTTPTITEDDRALLAAVTTAARHLARTCSPPAAATRRYRSPS
jgi:hypothetical protein